jgi:uncharacterized membrane protein
MGPPIPPKNPNPQAASNPGNRPGARVIATAYSQVTLGPLPPPELLRGYEQICPGGADRIIKMAEVEGDHRRRMEKTALDAQIESMRRGYSEARLGQIFAFAIATIFLAGGSYVAVQGQPLTGSLFGSVGLVGIVSAFIWGRAKEQKPEEEPAVHREPKKKQRP